MAISAQANTSHWILFLTSIFPWIIAGFILCLAALVILLCINFRRK